ncbi:profilin-4-like isoform X1 [Mercenaria mercenaria]|uniref:profilin-4-like isoform X1 n=1 Tax=Mercenaria mercenaria TaxID=6596 RepID=UPI001E1D473A|nr:profilin-4-like isoform X1 [Mercenaria mercenaria]
MSRLSDTMVTPDANLELEVSYEDGPIKRTPIEVVDAVKMNQLQNLLHDALISTEHVQQCAIVRRKDCSVRANSVGFNLYQDQVQLLLDAFKNPPQTREEGIYFDDRQYRCVRADKTSIYGKCENRGLILVKTLTLLLIATYTDSMFPSVCVEAVEKLADYFKEKGK